MCVDVRLKLIVLFIHDDITCVIEEPQTDRCGTSPMTKSLPPPPSYLHVDVVSSPL